MKKRNSHTKRNWIIAIIVIVSIIAKPVSDIIKISDFIIADFIDIEKTNQNDILEIDENQFDKELLNKSKKTLGQFEFRKTKLVRSLNSVSYTEVDIDVIIPPPDYKS